MNIKVILISNVKKLGVSGDVVHVRSGYARNFLIPQEKIVIATKENLLILHKKKMKLKQLLEQHIEEAKNRVKQLELIKNVRIYSKSGDEGKLFGSVNRIDIVKAICQLGLLVNKKEIKLLHGPLRTIGAHLVIFQPHSKVKIQFLVEIISDER